MKRFVEARRKKMRVVCRRLMEAPAPLKMIQDQRIVNRSDQRAWREICHLAVAVCSYTTHHWDITENPSSVLLLTTDSCQLEEDAHGLDWRVVSEIWHGVCLSSSPPFLTPTHTHTHAVFTCCHRFNTMATSCLVALCRANPLCIFFQPLNPILRSHPLSRILIWLLNELIKHWLIHHQQ